MKYRRLNHFGSLFLTTHISGIYELSSFDEESCYKTIPNALIGLTVLVEGSAWVFDDEKWEPVKKSTLYGMIKKPSLIKVSKKCRDISIIFSPVFLSTFLNVPMSIVSGCFTEAFNVFSIYDLVELEDGLSLAKDDLEIIKVVEKFLMKYLNKKIDKDLLYAYCKIAKMDYNRVDQLSNDLRLSPRTLLNKFNDKIGLSPKELMKIFRINNSLNVRVYNPENLTDLAYKLGYFDQSHFIRDFKQTLGITPEKYFTNKNLISDFYNSERWNLT